MNRVELWKFLFYEYSMKEYSRDLRKICRNVDDTFDIHEGFQEKNIAIYHRRYHMDLSWKVECEFDEYYTDNEYYIFIIIL